MLTAIVHKDPRDVDRQKDDNIGRDLKQTKVEIDQTPFHLHSVGKKLMRIGSHEFHETCHSVTFIVLVNSHQR